MKISIFFTAVLSLLLMVILFPTCKDDVIPPDPSDPIEVDIPPIDYNVQGYRLYLDSIVALGNGDNNSKTEYVGYIKVTPKYDDGYVYSDDNLEKKESVLLWYRQYKHYLELKQGESRYIGSYCDFLFNKDHLGKANLDIESWILEDDNDGSDWYWFMDHIESNQIGKQNTLENIEDISTGLSNYIRLNDIEEFETKIYYHFEPIYINDEIMFPDGVSPDEQFNRINELWPTPRPTSYSGNIPSSDRVVVAQQPVTKLYLNPSKIQEGAWFWYPKPSAHDVANKGVKFISDSGPISPEFTFDKGDDNLASDWQGCVLDGWLPGNSIFMWDSTIEGDPLENTPMLQVVQYWRPVNIWRMPAGASKEFSVTKETGWNEEIGYGIGLTLSYSCGFGLAEFGTELETTFDYTFSTHGSTSTTEIFSYAAPEDKNVIYVNWQLVSEFRLVGMDGKIFQDPNYEFRSIAVAITFSDELIEEAYLFDAN